MADELKTAWTGESVEAFIETIESEAKRRDAYVLLARFADVSGRTANMWGPSIIGYGAYRYTYASGHSGEAPLVGFSPQKARFSLYVAAEPAKREELLSRLGKHKAAKSCVYVNKVADIDLDVLDELIRETMRFIEERHEVL